MTITIDNNYCLLYRFMNCLASIHLRNLFSLRTLNPYMKYCLTNFIWTNR